MKLLTQIFPLGLVMLAVAACSSPSADFDAEAVVSSANEQWNTAFNNKEIDALVDLYSEQATLSAGDGKVLNGQQEITTLFEGFFDYGLHNHQIDTLATYSAAGQVSQLANWSANVAGENGEMVTVQGVLMTVLQQNSQGDWEVVSHIWNMAQ